MQAQTIELLSGKGTFSTEQALILAEAIDQVVDKAQFVTAPMLDARIATVTARIDALDAKLSARIESGGGQAGSAHQFGGNQVECAYRLTGSQDGCEV